jgi:hypothetical protein
VIILIFFVENYGNHCGIYEKRYGYFDLTLAGVRNISLKHEKFPTDRFNAYKFGELNPSILEFYRKSQYLPSEIRFMEKKQRGWNRTRLAGDYVLKLRKKRSITRESLNCVEWLLLGLEQDADYSFPTHVLTPQQLDKWCEGNLICIGKNLNTNDLTSLIDRI